MAVTPAQRIRIKQEAGFRCAIPNCNATSPLEIHHIQHRANGGSDNDDNLICLCRNCHGRVHDGDIPELSIREYKARLLRIYINASPLFPHEMKYLEALYRGENVELNADTVDLARRLERRNLITITLDNENDIFMLEITDEGRNFIE